MSVVSGILSYTFLLLIYCNLYSVYCQSCQPHRNGYINKLNSERLIADIQKNPIVYNVSNSGYHDNDLEKNV